MIMQIFEQGLLKLFILVLNMTLTGCVVILAVMLARLALKKAPRIFSYALWGVVLFRLLCPVSFSLPVSLLGALQNEPAEEGRMEYITEDILYMEKPEVMLPAPGISGAVNEMLPLADPAASVNPMQIYLIIGAYIWLLGILSMGVYSVIFLHRLRRKLKDSVWEKENIYRMKDSMAPFVYGLFRPRIYLPEKIMAQEEQYILLHEQIHIKRGDAVFRLLAYLALCVHWFNPLAWAAFALSGRDMEMSCDEAVIGRLGSKVKKEYSASLLNAVSGGQIVKGIPLAFGESDTGSRIKNVLRYQKPAALAGGSILAVSILLAVFFAANPARAKENGNIFYGIVTEVMGEDGAPETIVRIPRFGDVVLPDAEDVSLYLERDAERIIMPGDLLRITFSSDQDIFMTTSDQYGRTLYRFAPEPTGKAESIQVMGMGFSIQRQEDERYLFTVPLGMASDAEAGDILEIYHFPKADTAKDIYIFPEEGELEQELLASTEVLSVDEENYDIWVELSAEEAEVFLSEFGFGISVELAGAQGSAGGSSESADGAPGGSVSEAYGNPYGADGMSGEAGGASADGGSNGVLEGDDASAVYAGMPAEGNGLSVLSPSLLAAGELPDGRYVVYARSISRSSRGFDLYVTEEEYEELPLIPFAENCEFRVNWEVNKVSYSSVNFDKFADLITQSARVINPTVYCEMEDGLVLRADLKSGYDINGFSWAEPAAGMWEDYAENAAEFHHITEAEVLERFYVLDGKETADIGEGKGAEQIEVYTGDIGDGASGVVIFKDASGAELGAETAHISRAGWNNIYIGEAEGTGFILTVHIEDRDTYGNYGYQVYRFGENGEIRQIAGSSFDFGGSYQYDDEMFRSWADDLSYYLEHSHLVLSSQDGEIRTERVSEADRYCYETLKRGL